MKEINKKKIMVIEDEALLLSAIQKKLMLEGHDVIGFDSGQKAIDYLSDNNKFPDAIWLDYYLKDIDGLQFMHQLQQLASAEEVPVIVVSNSASDEKVHNMLALGAKEYFLKAQYRLDEIIKVLDELVSHKH